MFDIEAFTEEFPKKLLKITNQEVEYINEIINLSHNNSKQALVKLSIETVQEINIIANVLYRLERKGITSANYYTKVKQFEKFCEKGLDEYGLDIRSSCLLPFQKTPFSNPADLYKAIDVLLTKHELNSEQKKNFYMELMSRERIPKQDDVKSLIENEKLTIESNYIHTTLTKLFFNLTQSEQEAILLSELNYDFSELYHHTLNQLSLNQFPEVVIDYLNYLESEKANEDIESTVEEIEHISKIFREHHFLSYPSCLTIEADYLNNILQTTQYTPFEIPSIDFDI